MKRFAKNFSALFFLAIAFSFGALLSAKLWHRPASAPLGHGGIVWETSLMKSMQEAKSARKLLLVDFYADWCTYCKEMDKTTYKNANLIRLSHRFVFARIDVDRNQDLAEKFRVEGLPTLVFLDSESSEIKRLEGYVAPPQLLLAMQTLLEKTH